MYITFIDTVEINGQTFFDGVSFEYVYDPYNKFYLIVYNDVEYMVQPEYVVETSRPSRFDNISYHQYASELRMDKTTDYFKAVKELKGIDMKENYKPQFRDGINPFKI